MTNAVVIGEGPMQGVYQCTLWGEVVHLEGAQAIGVFAGDYYASKPALTVHKFGFDNAYYLATYGNEDFVARLLLHLCQEVNILPLLGVPERLEVIQRRRNDGRSIYFLLNHSEISKEVVLPHGNVISLLDGKLLTECIKVAAHDIVVLLEGGEKKS